MSKRGHLEVELRAELVELARLKVSKQGSQPELAARHRMVQQRLDDLTSGDHERVQSAMHSPVHARLPSDGVGRTSSGRSLDGLKRVISHHSVLSRDTNKSFRQSHRDLFVTDEPARRYNLTTYEVTLCGSYADQAVRRAVSRVNPTTQRPAASTATQAEVVTQMAAAQREARRTSYRSSHLKPAPVVASVDPAAPDAPAPRWLLGGGSAQVSPAPQRAKRQFAEEPAPAAHANNAAAGGSWSTSVAATSTAPSPVQARGTADGVRSSGTASAKVTVTTSADSGGGGGGNGCCVVM